jgi:DNA-directed RNA polymerase subunit RPC12/RpoP
MRPTKLYICPSCGRRGVTVRRGRLGGDYRCRYCAHYPGWLSPPIIDEDRRELIAERVRHGQEVIGEFCARMTGK